jgi:hypothetical protein
MISQHKYDLSDLGLLQLAEDDLPAGKNGCLSADNGETLIPDSLTLDELDELVDDILWWKEDSSDADRIKEEVAAYLAANGHTVTT